MQDFGGQYGGGGAPSGPGWGDAWVANWTKGESRPREELREVSQVSEKHVRVPRTRTSSGFVKSGEAWASVAGLWP